MISRHVALIAALLLSSLSVTAESIDLRKLTIDVHVLHSNYYLYFADNDGAITTKGELSEMVKNIDFRLNQANVDGEIRNAVPYWEQYKSRLNEFISDDIYDNVYVVDSLISAYKELTNRLTAKVQIEMTSPSDQERFAAATILVNALEAYYRMSASMYGITKGNGQDIPKYCEEFSIRLIRIIAKYGHEIPESKRLLTRWRFIKGPLLSDDFPALFSIKKYSTDIINILVPNAKAKAIEVNLSTELARTALN